MASIERQVDELQDKVDELQRQYDRLQALLEKTVQRIGQIEIRTGGYTRSAS